MGTAFSMLTALIILLTNFWGEPVELYLAKIRLVFKIKSVAIFFALSISPVIGFRFYLMGIFDVQCTGNLFSLVYTWFIYLHSIYHWQVKLHDWHLEQRLTQICHANKTILHINESITFLTPEIRGRLEKKILLPKIITVIT